MKIKLLLLFSIVLVNLQTKGQVKGNKNISINGFSLCQASITELKELDPNLKEVIVEEMDHPVSCFGEDSRFENGKGYSSSKYPGIIFQKEQTSDIISKVRLTKEFKGKLPDGTYIDMQNLSAKDVLNKYPKFDTWGSRDCSDYWSLSNDTLLFYVKIDKKPRYPIDEKYYLEKPIESIDLVVSCYKPSEGNESNFTLTPTDPVFFIDSVRVTKNDLIKYEPNQIASVTVYKDKSAWEKFGSEAVNGLIYIETKNFAKKRYWDFLCSKSTEYKKLVPEKSQDIDIVYILNNKVLKENFEGDLASINNENLINLKIINGEILKSDFNITDKKGGVVITSKPTEKNKK
ncbi:hypothetical protein ACVWYG_001550 [Pedobacter sp. UYEF25]